MERYYTTEQAREKLVGSAYCICRTALGHRLAVHRIHDNQNTIYGFRSHWNRDASAAVYSLWDAEKIDMFAAEKEPGIVRALGGVLLSVAGLSSIVLIIGAVAVMVI